MNELIQISAPGWVSISLIVLTIISTCSIIGYFIGFITLNQKLGEFTIKLGVISFISLFALIIVSIAIGEYMITNPSSYTVTKTENAILINSKSEWVANSTYNIINHKNNIYYLENEEKTNHLIKISDDELNKMLNQNQ